MRSEAGRGACWPGGRARAAERGGQSCARPGASGDRMAEPTRAAEPGRFALRSPRCREGAVPGASAQRPKKKAFYLLRMKPLKEPAPNHNNVSFVIHCQLGKEIKHICSNCSRGEDARDGECQGARGGGERGRRGGGSAGPPCYGHRGVCCLETCGNVCPLPRRDTRRRGTSQSAAQSPAGTVQIPHTPRREGFEALTGTTPGFSLGKVAFRVFGTGNSISFRRMFAPAVLAFWAWMCSHPRVVLDYSPGLRYRRGLGWVHFGEVLWPWLRGTCGVVEGHLFGVHIT